MRLCQDCQKPIEYGRGWGANGVCPTCRGKRSANVIREKVRKHGPGYCTSPKKRRSADARREA